MIEKNTLVGNKYGKLTVISFYGISKFKERMWNCICECGNKTKPINTSDLRKGHSKSCGCLRNELTLLRSTTHGKRWIDEYKTWCDMKARCYNVNNKAYKHYGGRGITVCDRWRNSFENFFEDMGKKPSFNLSLDRYPDNNGNYQLSNCRWATIHQQQRNKRNNIWIEYNGEKLVLKDWAKKFNVNKSTLQYHLNKRTIKEIVEFYKYIK